MIPQSKQAGAALLSILLIVATLSVAALMATEAIARQTDLQKLSARRTAALWAARSAEAAALAGAADLVAASRLPAGSGDTGREQTLVLPVESGQIILTLRELPPCLNLNALANSDETTRAPQAAAFAVLLEDIGVPRSDAAALAATLGDWIDADQIPQPDRDGRRPVAFLDQPEADVEGAVGRGAGATEAVEPLGHAKGGIEEGQRLELQVPEASVAA